MPPIAELLKNGPLVAAISTLLAAAVTHFAGGFKWMAGEVSKYLAARRSVMLDALTVPKKSLLLVPSRGIVWPTLTNLKLDDGRLVSSCTAQISVTALIDRPVKVTGREVKLRGWGHRNRKVYATSLSWSNSENPNIPRGQGATVWALRFYVLPALPVGDSSLLVDIVLFDGWGNANKAEKVRFGRVVPDSLPVHL